MWCGEVAFIGKVHATLRQISDRIPTNITKLVGNQSELLNGQIFRQNSVGIQTVKKMSVGISQEFERSKKFPSEFCRNSVRWNFVRNMSVRFRRKFVRNFGEIPTKFLFPTKYNRRLFSSEICRKWLIPTDFRRNRPQETSCFLVVLYDISTNYKSLYRLQIHASSYYNFCNLKVIMLCIFLFGTLSILYIV